MINEMYKNYKFCIDTTSPRMGEKYEKSIKEVKKPSWINFYMNQAINVSQRSSDAQTKHGCIFTDFDNHQLSCGYNAPAKNLPHNAIPNFRTPEEETNAHKYKFFLHSEINAIINSTVPLWSIQGGIRAFITGVPCTYCLSAMINCNLRELYYFTDVGWSRSADEKLDFEFLIEHGNVKLFPQNRVDVASAFV